jgi:hypothetical protein
LRQQRKPPGAHGNAETAGALRFHVITGGHVKTGLLRPFQFHRFLAINQHMGGGRRAQEKNQLTISSMALEAVYLIDTNYC